MRILGPIGFSLLDPVGYFFFFLDRLTFTGSIYNDTDEIEIPTNFSGKVEKSQTKTWVLQTRDAFVLGGKTRSREGIFASIAGTGRDETREVASRAPSGKRLLGGMVTRQL